MHVKRVSRARRRGAFLTAAVLLATAAAASGATATPPSAPTPPTAPAATPVPRPVGDADAAERAAAARQAALPPPCSAAYRIQQTLDGGTTWRMCWRYDTDSGLVLDNITYQPKGEAVPIRVLKNARLGQIHVPYDDGNAEYDDLTGAGFGWGLENLAPAECPGGTIRTVKVPELGSVKGLCATTRARGHAYRLASDEGTKVWQSQGKDLLLYTVNKVAWYEYITEWRFSSDGTVSANVGATGSLAPGDYNAGDGRGWPIGNDGARSTATSHSHNVFWRLNFALDGTPRDRIEQYDSVVSPPTGRGGPTTRTTRTPITKEAVGDAKTMRWWRVVSATGKNKDGHRRSYELVPGASNKHAGRGFSKHDVFFTRNRACEKFASNNIVDCGRGAPDSVDKWVNGEALVDPVVWVNIGFHHIARDEDQQPMPVHWQGFQLAPRDVTHMSPLTPRDLAGENGAPRDRS
ncbi:copper amine oxidase [Streptomyces sp. NPDC050504]|uniref:copper amine oxidase n=1 Tax=Streptomyces sp. NPDC050504 TaxID=3365618 RepID=UPI0037B0BB65